MVNLFDMSVITERFSVTSLSQKTYMTKVLAFESLPS